MRTALRVDGFLSRKAQEVWGPHALVLVQAGGGGAGGPAQDAHSAAQAPRQCFELHREETAPVVLGWTFRQARGGLSALMRAYRARERDRAAEEAGKVALPPRRTP